MHSFQDILQEEITALRNRVKELEADIVSIKADHDREISWFETQLDALKYGIDRDFGYER